MSKRFDPVYLRGGVWWCRVRNRAGRIVRKTTRCRDREAALRAWQAFERAAVDTDHAAAAEATFAGCLIDYFSELAISGAGDVTIEIAKQKCGHMARLWRKGLLPMAQVSKPLVNEYIEQRLREGVGRYTVKRELQHLERLLTVARANGKFHLDPKQVLPPIFKAGYKPRKRSPSFDELRSLVAQLGTGRAAHVLFIVATGARRSESFAAQRADVDWGSGLVHLRGTKTAKSRGAVPITPIMEPLLRWSLDQAPGKVRLFNPWGMMWRDIGAACVRAGIEHLSCNDLRRAFAGWHREALMAVGGSASSAAELVSKLLRHATDRLAQTTYADVDAQVVGRAISKLLGPAKDAVPILYQTASKTDETESNVHDESSPKSPKPEENTGAGHGARTRDLRLGKPKAISASKRYEDRLSVGTRLGRERAREDRNVLKVYRGVLLGVLAARAAS